MLDKYLRIEWRRVGGGDYLFFSRSSENNAWGNNGNKLGMGHKGFCLGTAKVVSEWDSVFRKMELTPWTSYCEEVFMYTLG